MDSRLRRLNRVGAVAILALALALVAALVSRNSHIRNNAAIETEQSAWFINPEPASFAMAVPSPAQEEELATVSPSLYTYPTATLGELAPVGPVLGRPVAANQGSSAETVVGELMPVLASQPPAPSSPQVAADNNVLLRELQQELEGRRSMADMLTMKEIARRHLESKRAIKRIENKLSELQGKEKTDDAKIDEDQGKISLLHAELAKAQAAESAKETEVMKVAKEEEKVTRLRKELEEKQREQREEQVIEAQEKELNERLNQVPHLDALNTLSAPLVQSASVAKAAAATASESSEHDTIKSSQMQAPASPTALPASSTPAGDSSLQKMVEANKAAIESLKEEFKRLRLVTHGEYGILYDRLESISSQLQQGTGSPSTDRNLVLKAEAAVRQGRQVVQKQARLQQLSSPPFGSHVIDFAKEFQPDRLFSGYNLAGGDHPGEALAQQRQRWLQQSLNKGDDSDPLVAKRRAIRSLLLKMAEGQNSADSATQDSDAHFSGPQHHVHQGNAENSEEQRDEVGFEKAERKRELAAIHPEAMHGVVFKHFIHQLYKGSKRPMLFDSAAHTREHTGPPSWDTMHLTSGYVPSGIARDD